MNPILVLLRKDFALFFRDKASISLTFLVPFALIYLLGQIFHVNSSSPGPAGIPVAVVNQSDNPAAPRRVAARKGLENVQVAYQIRQPRQDNAAAHRGGPASAHARG